MTLHISQPSNMDICGGVAVLDVMAVVVRRCVAARQRDGEVAVVWYCGGAAAGRRGSVAARQRGSGFYSLVILILDPDGSDPRS